MVIINRDNAALILAGLALIIVIKAGNLESHVLAFSPAVKACVNLFFICDNSLFNVQSKDVLGIVLVCHKNVGPVPVKKEIVGFYPLTFPCFYDRNTIHKRHNRGGDFVRIGLLVLVQANVFIVGAVHEASALIDVKFRSHMCAFWRGLLAIVNKQGNNQFI